MYNDENNKLFESILNYMHIDFSRKMRNILRINLFALICVQCSCVWAEEHCFLAVTHSADYGSAKQRSRDVRTEILSR
jgi:hypothetical protein